MNHAAELGPKLAVKDNEGKDWTTGTHLSIPLYQVIEFYSFTGQKIIYCSLWVELVYLLCVQMHLFVQVHK